MRSLGRTRATSDTVLSGYIRTGMPDVGEWGDGGLVSEDGDSLASDNGGGGVCWPTVPGKRTAFA